MIFPKKTTALILLLPVSFSLFAKNHDDQLIVTANRFSQPVSTVLAPIDIITKDDIDRWQVTSLGEILKRLPGVDITQYGGRGQSASLYIRGNDSHQILVLIDGVRLVGPGITGAIDFNQIPLALVERIEFIRGARSSVYGSDAVGGVINLITKREDDVASINMGTGSNQYYNSNGAVRYSLSNKTTISVAGSYEHTNGFNIFHDSPMIVDKDKDGFAGKSLWFGLEHQLNKESGIFFRGYGYDNTAEYDQTSLWGGSDKRLVNSRNYDLGMTYQKNDYSSQFVISYQKFKDHNYENEKGAYHPDSVTDDISQRSFMWGNSYRLENGMLSAGLDWREERTKPNTAYVDDGKVLKNLGVYLTAQKKHNQLMAESAVRFDDSSKFGHKYTWQGAAAWEFEPDNNRLSLSYATAFRTPTLGKLYSPFYGNPLLKPEESRQWELMFEADTGPLHWSVTGYHNRIDNQIVYENNKHYNIGKVVIKGVEWKGEIDTGQIHHSLILEYLDPKERVSAKQLGRRTKKKARYQLDWKINDVDMNLAYNYNGKRYDDNANINALSAFNTIDIAMSYPIITNLTVRGRIMNLFDERYETAKGYATGGREYFISGNYQFW